MNSNTSDLKDEDWQNLRQEVERYYPTFREAMYQGEYLKPKEYNLCLLIKADFIGQRDRISVRLSRENAFYNKKKITSQNI